MPASLPAPHCAPPRDATPLGGQRAVVAGLEDLVSAGIPAVLAVVVGTSGSTYRKPGALILLDQRGVRAGALSGGCLEAELEECARLVLETGVAAEARF
ncbi:MAG: XdhC family protein, partial [Dokdonella sp.]|uniref:XdhC family protein n=1 Tax=Dokdonella sp. TaxID=2291710 RepID=UPI00326386ED